MESFSISKTLNLSISPKFQTLKPSIPKTLTLIQSSLQSPTPKTLTLKSLPSLLKPAILSLTVASSIFLSRHSLPAKSQTISTPPSSQSQSHPNEFDILKSLLRQNLEQNKLPEAIEMVDHLIVLDPDDLDLHLLKANLHTYNGEIAKSRLHIEKIITLNPFAAEAYHGLVMAATRNGETKKLGSIVERVERVMKICQNESKRRDLKILVGQIWIIEGKFEEALEVYEELAREESGDFRPFLCKGIVFTLMRRTEEADESFKKYRELVPEDHPYARLFEDNLSGINGLLRRRDDDAKI